MSLLSGSLNWLRRVPETKVRLVLILLALVFLALAFLPRFKLLQEAAIADVLIP